MWGSGWAVLRGKVGDQEKRRRSGSKRDGSVSVVCRVLVKDVVLTVYDSWSFGCGQEKRCSWVSVVVPQQRHVGVDQKLQRAMWVPRERDLW